MSRQRFVVVGIVALAIIASVPLAHFLQWGWIRLGWNDMPLISRDVPLTAVISYGVALAAIVFCLKHRTTYQLATEVADEMTKVTWPSREETGYATVVVLVTVAICSIYLGVFDAVWLWVTDWILGIERMPAT